MPDFWSARYDVPRSQLRSFRPEDLHSPVLIASALTAIGQNPTETGLMINGPDSLRGRTATVGTYLTAPGTGALAVKVFAERNGTRVDRQALLKLVDRTTQKALWATTDDRAQGMFTNISYGTYVVEVSAVGFFSAPAERC